jgi:predicted nucleotidyltransferase
MIEADLDRAEARRTRAVAGAKAVVAALAPLGVRVIITGSLARGGFTQFSDVDFLVMECPRKLKYAIESIVEDTLEGLPFDVIYLDEVPAWRVPRLTEGAVEAADLR